MGMALVCVCVGGGVPVRPCSSSQAVVWHCLTLFIHAPLLCLQEEIIPFFQNVTLSSENKDVFSCYLELAEKVWAMSVCTCLLCLNSAFRRILPNPEGLCFPIPIQTAVVPLCRCAQALDIWTLTSPSWQMG